MKFVIVTGMSGAGKSTAMKMMEDMGYFCIDNLPIQLLDKLIDFSNTFHSDVSKVAVGIDVRNGSGIDAIPQTLEQLRQKNFPYEILFLDAEDEVLVKRYKETRRNHPLAGSERINKGIVLEREKLQYLKDNADYIIDTSQLLTRELKIELEKIFVQNEEYSNFIITVMSFGFKYGIPEDADLVFDVRFLPNPYYIDELKPLTGNDKPIKDYVMGFDIAHQFLEKLTDMIEFLIPNYILEGKNRLVIAIGCTGGRHRSVTLANELYNRLEGGEYGIKIDHRDINLDTKTKR